MNQVWMHTDKDWQGPQKNESCVMIEEFDFFLKKMFSYDYFLTTCI